MGILITYDEDTHMMRIIPAIRTACNLEIAYRRTKSERGGVYRNPHHTHRLQSMYMGILITYDEDTHMMRIISAVRIVCNPENSNRKTKSETGGVYRYPPNTHRLQSV